MGRFTPLVIMVFLIGLLSACGGERAPGAAEGSSGASAREVDQQHPGAASLKPERVDSERLSALLPVQLAAHLPDALVVPSMHVVRDEDLLGALVVASGAFESKKAEVEARLVLLGACLLPASERNGWSHREGSALLALARHHLGLGYRLALPAGAQNRISHKDQPSTAFWLAGGDQASADVLVPASSNGQRIARWQLVRAMQAHIDGADTLARKLALQVVGGFSAPTLQQSEWISAGDILHAAGEQQEALRALELARGAPVDLRPESD